MRRLALSHVRGRTHARGCAFATGAAPPSGDKPSLFSLARIQESDSYPRWRAILPSVATHMCIGAPYAWSIFNGSLTKALGVVSAAPGDLTLGQVVPVLSAVFVVQGVSAAMLGKRMEGWTPRQNGLLSAACFGGGFLLGGLGVHLHSLPLLYLGCGVFAGLGVGIGYVPAVKNLIGWFPDRTGFATGVTIMGFGGAALLATPLADRLMHAFRVAPTYLGAQGEVPLVFRDGKRFATLADGTQVEAVVATMTDLLRMSFTSLPEGVYQVGTGSTGAAATLGIFGAAYFTVLAASAMAFRVAPTNYSPVGWTRPASTASSLNTYVAIDNLMKTPQFWLMFTTFAGIASAGLAVSSVARNMMADIFGAALPALVTAGFASGYLMAMSAANLSGRLVWSSLSDRLGRRNMFLLLTFGSIPLYVSMPLLVNWLVESPSVAPLALFYAASLLSYSFFGASYAIMPAFESDVFGAKTITATHGRMLLASALAALAGPGAVVYLRSLSEHKFIRELALLADPAAFKERFGLPLSSLEELLRSNSLSIDSLLPLCPAGTLDPTPYLYNTSMYVAAGVMSVSALAVLAHRPVDPKWLTVDTVTTSVQPPFAQLLQQQQQQRFQRVWMVAVDSSLAAQSAFSWTLLQAKEGDVVMPLAIVPDGSLSDAPRILHPFVMEAKRLKVPVSPLFTGASVDQLGAVLLAVARKKGAHALILGRKGPESSLALGEFVLKHQSSPVVVAYVSESDTLAFGPAHDVPVRKDLLWAEVDSGVFESVSRRSIKD